MFLKEERRGPTLFGSIGQPQSIAVANATPVHNSANRAQNDSDASKRMGWGCLWSGVVFELLATARSFSVKAGKTQ
jgi:hypothetical protein